MNHHPRPDHQSHQPGRPDRTRPALLKPDATVLDLPLVLCLVLTFAVIPRLRSDDWPQWMGPERDDVWRETRIIEKFDTNGLPVKWRVPVRAGYVGPAVARGRLFMSVLWCHPAFANRSAYVHNGRELLCLDLAGNRS